MKTCPRCDKEHAGRGVHCSRHCAKIKDLPYKVCSNCGKQFRKNPEYSYVVWGAMKYCSQECMGIAYRKPARECETCGATLTRRSSVRFCSTRCYGDWKLGTGSFDSPAPYFSKRGKRVLLERAGNVCQQCGSTKSLEFDHVLPRAAGGTSAVENGQVLCQACHCQKTLSEHALMRRLLREHYGLVT